ncbi:hypothetical protein ACLOJK_028376 [Asimina triloba]
MTSLIVSGYRSPLRPIPNDTIPENMAVFNLMWAANCGGMMNVNLDLQCDKNNLEFASTYKGESIMDGSPTKDSGWWLEVMRITDDIENTKKASNFGKLDGDISDEDYDWWMEVERTTSQAEQEAGLRGAAVVVALVDDSGSVKGIILCIAELGALAGP